jgi:branched-chain amino acid aminotransferase
MSDTVNIQVNQTTHSRLAETDFSNLPFGKIFTDHMFLCDYKDGQWQNARIVPYGAIPMFPSISGLHYGQQIFEGIKAYKHADGNIVIFRPDKNWERFNKSAVRMAMPEVPKELFMQSMAELIKLDAAWVPAKQDHSLYIRPFMYATDPYIGVKPADTYTYAVLTCPAGKYYSKAINVKIETSFTRADDGGVGFAKTGGNYARSLYPFEIAKYEGFDQLIWTDAQTHEYIEEAGTANLLFVLDGKLVTPSVRTTVLDGVTRDTLIQLAKDAGIEVEERRVSVKEVIEGIANGKLTEAFAAGTAATVTQIGEIGFDGKRYPLSDPASRTVSNSLAKKLDDIKYGMCSDTFGWNWKIS